MIEKRSVAIALTTILCALILTICAGEEALEARRVIAKESKVHESAVSFVPEIPTLHLTPWELHVLSDVMLDITTILCPIIQKPALHSLKAYIRERVAHAYQGGQLQNRGLLPVYGNLVQCYNRLTAEREVLPGYPVDFGNLLRKISTKTTSTTTVKAIVAESTLGHHDADLKTKKDQELVAHHFKKVTYLDLSDGPVKRDEPHHTFRIWTVIKSAIHKFSSFLSRRKRSTGDVVIAATVKPEEPNTATDVSANAAEQKKFVDLRVHKAQQEFSKITSSLIDIASYACLREMPQHAEFLQQAMNEVLYYVSSDYLITYAKSNLQMSHLLRGSNRCARQVIG